MPIKKFISDTVSRCRKILARARAFLVGLFDIRDAFAFMGLGFLWYGLAEIFPPIAWIVVGSCLFWLGARR
jgi:hypothetical protein